jgi:hypothetical protein
MQPQQLLQQQQPQQQVVLLQIGQGISSSGVPGGYDTITLPVSNTGQLGVLASGVHGTVVVRAQQVSQPQQLMQYSMPGRNQQVLECNLSGNNKSTHWVTFPDPTLESSASTCVPQQAVEQMYQNELAAANIALGSSSLPTQAFVLGPSVSNRYTLQQQQQQHQQPGQGFMSLQALNALPPAGSVQVGALDSAPPWPLVYKRFPRDNSRVAAAA